MTSTQTAEEHPTHLFPPLLNLGFRPFFLGASIFSALSIALWLAVYHYQLPLPLDGISPYHWHAHEMIYGYAMAVIAGFLLTAVRNWTDLPTAHGALLGALFLCWGLARLAYLVGTHFMVVAALGDGLFILGLMVSVAVPIIKAKEWERLGILSKLILLGLGNVLFYLGYWQILALGMYWSIYGGLYLVLGLVMTLGRKLIPHFIERDAELQTSLTNHRWVDLSSLILFLIFFGADLFWMNPLWTGIATIGLFALSCIRLVGWYTNKMWRNPLLWSLYLAFANITLGFLLFFLSTLGWVARYTAIHAFTVGGLGLITLSMMARVCLGHTGRNVRQTPKAVFWVLGLVGISMVFRVVLPILDASQYMTWIGIAQVLWIAAFAWFALIFGPMLFRYSLENYTD